MIDRANRERGVESWLHESHQDLDEDRLRLALLEAAHAIALACHRDERTKACGCGAVGWSAIAILTSPDRDPRAAFLHWMRSWLVQVDRNHPEPPVERAAALIRARPNRRWTASTLSAETGARRRQFPLLFASTFGLSLSDYVHLVRVERAVCLVAEAPKIESVAREVGYRSKKDFYAAMQRWIGVTPARLRAWSAEDRSRLRQRLETLAREGVAELAARSHHQRAGEKRGRGQAYGLMPSSANLVNTRRRSS